MPKHATQECGTTYPRGEDAHNNPIHGRQQRARLLPLCLVSLTVPPSPLPAGLVVHRLHPSRPTSTPVYTLVRAHAAADTATDWCETNAPAAAKRQWQREIDQKIELAVPADALDDGSSESGSESLAPSVSDQEDVAESLPDQERPPQPDVHLYRVRLWGLAASPGGGCSAVLVSFLSTQKPDRGGWHSMHSSILFGWTPPRRAGPAAKDGANDVSAIYRGLTTEARMWEWMYGGGPGVPGIISDAAGDEGSGAAGAAVEDARAEVRKCFEAVAREQTCTFCDSPVVVIGPSEKDGSNNNSNNNNGGSPGINSMCTGPNGHIFGERPPVPPVTSTRA